MRPSVTSTSSPTFPGSARAFVAARRRRRGEVAEAPQLRWNRPATGGSAREPDGTPVWKLQVVNIGGTAVDTTFVLFTPDAVVRGTAGDAGTVEAGSRWDVIAQQPRATTQPVRGFVVASDGAGGWFATTVDGRTASFRSRPDELGVLNTLGLRIPLGATPQEAAPRCERIAADTAR